MVESVITPEVVEKRKVGRPRKTIADLPKDWKKIALDLSAKGYSKEEIFLHFYRINAEMFYQLKARDAEFSDTIKDAEHLCKAWWIEQSRKSLKRSYFQAAIWYMNMKNRFGWKDRQEVMFDASENLIEKLKDVQSSVLLERTNELLNRNQALITSSRTN